MAGFGIEPNKNLLRDGFEECARYVHWRRARDGSRLVVYVDESGWVRFCRADAIEHVPEELFVGNYNRKSQIEEIEDDMLGRERELRTAAFYESRASTSRRAYR